MLPVFVNVGARGTLELCVGDCSC